MATFTENYGLIKPGLEDYYDIADFNDNMDTIDRALGKESSAIKSVQRFTYQIPKNVSETALPIKKVNPEKCMVILERLADPHGSVTKVDYVLHEASFVVSHEKFTDASTPTIIFGFQIIEFC